MYYRRLVNNQLIKQNDNKITITTKAKLIYFFYEMSGIIYMH